MERGFQIQPFDQKLLPQVVAWVRPLWTMVDLEGSVSTVDLEGSVSTLDLEGGGAADDVQCGPLDGQCGPLDVEFIVRHNIFRNEFSLQLVEAGRLLAVAFAARLGEQNDSLQWLEQNSKTISAQEAASLQLVVDYLEDMDARICRHMREDDIRLTLFASGVPGFGGLILGELEERLRTAGFKSMYLWTDSDCNHQWYPAHGFTLVEEAKNEAFSTAQRDFMTYIFRKDL